MSKRRRTPVAHPLNAYPAIALVTGLTEALAVLWPTRITLALIAAVLAYWIAGMIREPRLAKETECLVIGALAAGVTVWLAPGWLWLLTAAVLLVRSAEAQHAVRGGVALWWPFSSRLYGVKARPAARPAKVKPAVPLPRRSMKEVGADVATRLPGANRALLAQLEQNVSLQCKAGNHGDCSGIGCTDDCGHAAAARRKRSTREQARRAVGAGVPAGGCTFEDAIGSDTPPF
jgi:hypothetical protein